MVIPRSRSRSMRSRYWSRIWRSFTAWVRSRKRSASVDLPWSMCATMQKLRIRPWSIGTLAYGVERPGRVAGGRLLQSAAVANIKSQIKRNRQNERHRVRNKSVRSALKTDAKKIEVAVEGADEGAQDLLQTAARELDRAASKGILHKRTAAR